MRRTGAERVIEVLVGGAVALILGVVLFPAEPLSILREAERSLLRALARTLEQVAGLVAADEQSQDGWTLETGHEIHRQLAALARAWSTARANVRVAPRRWHRRAVIDAEDRRTAQLDLVAKAVLGLVRAASVELAQRRRLPDAVRQQIQALTGGLQRLASTPQPWPPEMRAEIDAVPDRQARARRGSAGRTRRRSELDRASHRWRSLACDRPRLTALEPAP